LKLNKGEREMSIFKASEIKWDTDGEDVTLPSSMSIYCDNDDEAEEYIAEELTRATGFCHLGFVMEKIS
jgi:hypothetical protein